MLRVLHAISGIDPQNGGPTTALLGLTRAQAALGAKVTVVATWQEQAGFANAQQFRAAGVQVHMVGPAYTALSWHPRLAAVLREAVAQADVVHIHALWEEIQHRAAREALRQARPYIMRPCGGLDPWAMQRSAMKKRVYLALRLRSDLHHAAAIHFTTDAERDAAQTLGVRCRAIVEPNGIDLAELAELPPNGAFRNQYPQLSDRRIVLFLGRLNVKKGLDILIDAFARAGRDDAMLVLAGPDQDGYSSELRRLARQQNIESKLLFTGMLHGRERIAALVDADLFVLSSHVENFGISVIEALAAGPPVLISDRVNLADVISRHHLGSVVPLSAEAFVAGINQQLDAPPRSEQRDRIRAFTLEQYDWSKIARRWMDHYQEMIMPTSRGGRPEAAP